MREIACHLTRVGGFPFHSPIFAFPIDRTVLTLTESQAKSTGASDMTVLESLFLGDWESMKFPDGSRAILITYGCRAWTFGSELLEQYNFIAPNVMGTFIKSGDLDLAVEFLKFLPRTPWAIYMKGRLCLARSEYAEASIYFKQAALGLGKYTIQEVHWKAILKRGQWVRILSLKSMTLLDCLLSMSVSTSSMIYQSTTSMSSVCLKTPR